MLTCMPLRWPVSRSAFFKISADSAGNKSSAPTGSTRQRPVAARSVTIFSITRSRGAISSALLRAGRVASHQRLTRRVGACPPPVAVRQHGDVSRQPGVIKFRDQSVFVGGVEQSGRVQAVHQFSQTLEASHDLQRIAASLVRYVRLSVASRRLLLPEKWLSTPWICSHGPDLLF